MANRQGPVFTNDDRVDLVCTICSHWRLKGILVRESMVRDLRNRLLDLSYLELLVLL